MNEKQNFVLPMGLFHPSCCLPHLNTQSSSSHYILSSIKLPIQKAKKATFNYGVAKIITLRLSCLLNFCKFPNVMQLKIIVLVPYEGQGPRVQFRVQVNSSHGRYNITTRRSISSPVALCTVH